VGVAYSLRLASVWVKNFGLVRDSGVVLSAEGAAYFVDGVNEDDDCASSNMSGKTTLFNAVTYSAYGCDVTGEKMAGSRAIGVHGWSSSVLAFFRVVGRMERDGREVWGVAVERSREDARHGARVRLWYLDHSHDGVLLDSVAPDVDGPEAEVDDVVQSIFGPRDLFLASCVFARGDGYASFAARTRSEKNRVLDLIVDNEDLERGREYAACKLREAQERESRLTGAVDALQRVEEDAVAEARAALGAIGVDLDAAQEEVDRLATEVRVARVEADRCEAEYDPVERALPAARAKLDEMRDDLNKFRRLARDARSAAGRAVEEARRVVVGLRAMDRAQRAAYMCEACGTVLGADAHKEELLAATMRWERYVYESMCVFEKHAARVIDARRKYATHKMRVVALEARGGELSGLLGDAYAALRAAHASLTAARVRASEAAKHSDQFRDKVTGRLRRVRRDLWVARFKLRVAHRSAERYAYWRTAFGPTGVRRARVDAIVPVLNQFADAYSRVLFGDAMQVRYSASRAGSGGREVEDFTVSLVLRDGSEAVSPSAGQRTRRDVVHMMTMCDLASALGRRRVDLLMFDEAFAALDEVGAQAVVDLLAQRSGGASATILVAEHDAELSRNFARRIVARRRGGEVTYECE